MSGWDVQPGGVYRTLESTGKVAEKLEGHGTSLSTHLENAAKHAGTVDMNGGGGESGGIVGAALAQFMQAKQLQVQFLARRTVKSLEGAGAATAAYLQGDEEMAADAQREALEFPKLDMPGSQQKGK